MKLIFFLIAFCLVFLRVYFTGPWLNKKGKDDVTITIENGDDYEQIRYGGKIKLSEDQKSIQRIAPGGYIKYKHNDNKFIVTSSLQGDLSYNVTYDGNQITVGDRDTILIREAIKEMIAYGFDAQSIMEQTYVTGGDSALMNAFTKMKSPGVINMYLERLMNDDSAGNYTIPIIRRISTMGSDNDKITYLHKLKQSQLKDLKNANAWFDVVEHLGSDNDKINMLNHWTGTDTIQQNIFFRILETTSHLGSDNDKVNMLNKFTASVRNDSSFVRPYFEIVRHLGSDNDKINIMRTWTKQDSISGNIIENILNITIHLGSANDRQDMIHALVAQKNITEEDWLLMIDAASQIGSDQDKSNLLIAIAQKMPPGDKLKSAYKKAAKAIGNDTDYGRAIRAIE
ncbi:MAG TPA: hypothetical protein VKI61_11435 [Chitinophagaceae bacterium]|nr:hypothetical protein [Chitinophagaceae bacterium]